MKKSITGILQNRLISSGTSSHEQLKRPNLLFIMTDQQRFDALGCAGNKIVKTPNLNRLASEGVYFINCHSHCPVCAPDRATILTGFGIEKTLMRTNEMMNYIQPDQGIGKMMTYDEILDEQGYWCTFHGKFHVPSFKTSSYKNSEEVGHTHELYSRYLDKNVPFRPPQMGELLDKYTNRPYLPDPIDRRYGLAPDEVIVDENGEPAFMTQPDNHGKMLFDAEHSVTAFQARQTIEAIKRGAESGKPFDITCSFHFPHAPMLPTEPYYSMYDPDDMPLPESINDPMDNNPFFFANGRSSMPEYSEADMIKYMISNYYGLVTEIDDWVGKILNTLEETGQMENTIVIFTSDHGEMLGDHGLREKNIFLEGSVRVPLMIRYPHKIKPGTVVESPVSHMDIFATILDYTGAGKFNSDGNSMRDLIEGTGERDYVVSEWNYANDGSRDEIPNFMIRTRKWKYIISRNPEKNVIDCLFDMENDPHEMNNLIGMSQDKNKYSEIAEQMKVKLVKYLERTDNPATEQIIACPAVK